MSVIAAEDLIQQKEGFLVSDMAGEKVMLSIENGKYYNLGKVGGRIWELMSQPVTINSLVGQLVTEYEIEYEVCEGQVHAFLDNLVAEGLIQVSKQ